jgi:hypothetical protein
MDCCGECGSEIPKNDVMSCPDWVPDRPVGNVCAGNATFEDVNLHSASLLLTNDTLAPESELLTERIVGVLLTAGVIIVCLGIVISVASVIFLLISGI